MELTNDLPGVSSANVFCKLRGLHLSVTAPVLLPQTRDAVPASAVGRE
jgi:hypothetical protein